MKVSLSIKASTQKALGNKPDLNAFFYLSAFNACVGLSALG